MRELTLEDLDDMVLGAPLLLASKEEVVRHVRSLGKFHEAPRSAFSVPKTDGDTGPRLPAMS